MFVSRKEHEDLKFAYKIKSEEIYMLKVKNEELKTLEKISADRIKGFKEQINSLELDCENLRGLVKVLEERNKELYEQNDKLLQVNIGLVTLVDRFTDKEEITNEESIC